MKVIQFQIKFTNKKKITRLTIFFDKPWVYKALITLLIIITSYMACLKITHSNKTIRNQKNFEINLI